MLKGINQMINKNTVIHLQNIVTMFPIHTQNALKFQKIHLNSKLDNLLLVLSVDLTLNQKSVEMILM